MWKFSCHFQFKTFPFDSQECCMSYGENKDNASAVKMKTAEIYFANESTKFAPIVVDNLHFPYEFHIISLPTFNYTDASYGQVLSKTGICINMKRRTRGHLDSGYYYPTTAFAVLSMISYLINPDSVNNYCSVHICHPLSSSNG